MPTKAECIKAAAAVAADAYRVLFLYPIEEAARRVVRPGGPTYEEQLERIAAIRAEADGSAVGLIEVAAAAEAPEVSTLAVVTGEGTNAGGSSA
jgi:hypothetical protein